MEPLSAHLLCKWEWPHVKFRAHHLLHILQPEHVIVIGVLLEATVTRSRLLGTDTWVADLLVLHHLNRGQIVIELDDDSEGQRDESNRDGQADKVGEVEAKSAK